MSSATPSHRHDDPSPLRSFIRGFFPPVTTRSFLAHYVPASGALSHTLFSMHIFSPSIITRLFPVGELAVSNAILFNANIGIGFYVFFRHHMHKLNSWERVEFAVFASTMFNFGSLLAAVLVKALLPTKTPTLAKSAVATALSLFLLRTGRKYLKYVDLRTARSPRHSPIASRNGSLKQSYGGDSPRVVIDGPNGIPIAQARGATPETTRIE